MIDYIKCIECLIIEKLSKKESVLIQHSIPPLYYCYTNNEIIKGINQIYLAENNFLPGIISVNEINKYNFKINEKKSLILSQKKNNFISYGVFVSYSNKLVPVKNIQDSGVYNISEIKELIHYYFTSSINHTVYSPFLDDKEILNLINFIKSNPYSFSELVNKVFLEFTEEIK